MSDQIVAELPDEIAVIGLAGRFPGARNVEEFWQNLRNGVESISLFSEQELIDAGITPALVLRKDYVKAKAILDDVELFDASFFNLTPREAEITDPQQRIFLECTWEALELAGYEPENYKGLVGVFAGTTLSRYLLNLYSHPDLVESVGSFLISLGNDKDYLATRVSYKLNLRGPSVTVQTACSTSLVAVHFACQSLLNGECDIALAGGVTVNIPQKSGYLYREGGINSPNGQCRAFDASAHGTVSGSGCGVVVLRRLADAIADGDYIHAVIKGSAINNDGSQKVGFTAPGVKGQASVITDALNMAGCKPESINYIEAHGTGTTLGDPIEIAALTEAFGARTDAKKFCAIGSVKSNVGHLDAAAGVTGLIKTVLSLKHKQLPPSLHFVEPNPKIDFDNSPFFVNARLREWVAGPTPRRAGVSSFGIGGTNAHVVLEEAPPLESDDARRPFQLLLLSAQTETALQTITTNVATHLRDHPNVNLADVAFTMHVGRRSFRHRRAVLCTDVSDAVSALEALDSRRVHTGVAEHSDVPVVFMFSGQGAQYVNMGHDLYREEATFREQVDACAELLKPELGLDLREVLFPPDANIANGDVLSQTFLTQPALFVIEYSLAKLWMAWGIRPEAMIGHSIGEYVAACLAGVFSLEDALAIVAARGRLMQELPGGVMLTVSLPENELPSLLSSGVSLAAINGPSRFVLSGPGDRMDEVEQRLAGDGGTYRRLRTSHAFHSTMMEPIGEAFAARLSKVRLGPLKIPFISNVSGTWITPAEAGDPSYWVKHLRQTVRFADGLRTLFEEPKRILLEVGPGRTLTSLAMQHPEKPVEQSVLTSLRSASEQISDSARLTDALGRLWLAGASIKWRNVNAGQKRLRLPLPTYPFEKKRHWIEHADRIIADTSAAPVNEEPVGEFNQNMEVPMFEVQAAEPAAASRQKQIVTGLTEIIFQLTGMKLPSIDPEVSFLEVGVDSLMMIQALRAIVERFGVEIPLVQLIEELSTFGALIEHINRLAPADRFLIDEPQMIQPKPVIAPPPAALAVPANSGNGAIDGSHLYPFFERIITQQLDVISRLAGALNGAATTNSANARAIQNVAVVPGPTVADASAGVVQNAAVLPAQTIAADSPHLEQEAWSPFQPNQPDLKGDLNDHQQRHLADLIERYNKRTAKSKELTQTYRPWLADNRASSGFRLRWKELVYPVVGERSKGAYVWDVDGNKYVDLTMGFGVHLFGHSPSFVVEALHEQIEQGVQLGPQSLLAGRVAELICELTAMQRVTFCNSGTEAVMTALRLARTVARRDKIALFAGSYHGSFDGTLARPLSAQSRAVPVAAGIPQEMVENLLILDYGSPESLEIIRAHGHELAAVLVEPVQSRRPSLQPGEYLHELRRVTKESGTLLIFDEVITGFRVCSGGAQAWFGVEADLVTYGKVVGGGMPIGIVAGRSPYMDAIDGGMWRYGDTSYPRAEKTFFAGTFCKHPLAMAGAQAVLQHLKQSGPSLQEQLNKDAARLAGALNDYFETGQVPMRVEHFGSMMRFSVDRHFKVDDLFFYHMIERGVYFWEGRTCFLSTAHAREDVDFIIHAAKESVEAIREGGFLPSATQLSPNGHAAAKTIPDETTYAPMTEGQRQLWILAQMAEKASVAYNESITLKLGGKLRTGALRTALQKVVERHESLRATVTAEGDRLRITSAVEMDIPFHDLSHLGEAERQRQAAELVALEARRPFDFVHGPLLRAQLIRFAPESHWLVLTMHHIIIDGWSTGILLRELKAFYEAEYTGAKVELPRPVSFADYARRQTTESNGVQTAAESYWLERFADGVPVLDLPADCPRPPVQSFSGEHLRATISTPLCQRLREFSSREGSTLLATTLAGFCLLLHRLSAQDDLIIAVPIADQSSLNEQEMIGYGLSVVPVRSRCDPQMSFANYMRSLRRAVLEGYQHRNYSLRSLTEKLKLRHDPSRHQLFSVLFNLDHSRAKPRFHELDIEIVSNQTGTTKFELCINMTETADELQIDLDYSTDLFNAETAERWLRHFERLLEAAVTDASQSVAQLPMLTEEELGQLVAPPRQHYPVTKCLHELFSEQAQRTPQATALSFSGEQLSYAELERRSALVASRLRRWGVGSEQLVALLCEPSLELVVGMLGILKAGGAYLPIDARHPAERVRTVLADSGARVLLTQAELAERLLEYPEQVLCLDTEWAELEREETVEIEAGVSPSHLAYVIYTSGSTGMPKGVMVTHANVARLLAATQGDYEFDSRDTWTLFHSPAFDFSVWEVWGALLTGGRLLVVPHLVSRWPEVFYRLLVQERVTVLNQTPSAFRVLSQVEGTSGETSEQLEPNLEPLSLRLVIFGGEALELESLRGWFERHGEEQPRLVNMYGITETTVHVTYRPLSVADLGQASVIGEAIEDLQVYLLDGHGQPVPLGVPGELFVGGAGVARGYLGRPELTAERFVPDPFTGEPGARLYRSGDVGRRLANGELEYLGRADRQVKIRGFRMELGEIEAALLAQAEVREAVVLIHEETPDDKKLVAYVVAPEAHARTSIGLRKELRERLPEYMVPSTFVFLDRLPLTPNGKVDQRALTEQSLAEEQEGEWVGPRTPIEEVVAGVWAEVLGVERVGVRDNFFELGGHSLLATQVMSRLRKAFGVEVEMRALFEAPTLEGVSRAVQQLLAEGREPAPPIVPVARERELPLSFAQQRLWFLQQFEPDSYLYNVPTALRLSGELDVEALGQSMNEVIRRHEVLRTSFPSEGGQPRQLISPPGQRPLEVLDLRALAEAEREAEVKRLVENDGRRPFDLEREPALRVQLLRVGEAEHVLQLTMHHIVSDGWSMGLLLKETATLYRTYSQGEKSPLAELLVQYADYAVWQRQWLQGEVLDEQLNYWRKQLTGAPPVLELPTDRPRPPIESTQGASLVLNFSAALSERVHELSRSHGATLYMTLLATFKLLLSRYAGQEDIVVGTPIAGRGHSELESLIGFFVNTLVLRTDVSGNPSFSELLGRVRRTCLEAYAHQDVPFERLVEELQPNRDLSRSPLFQVMFALENALDDSAAELPGLQLRPVEYHHGTSKFDLIFTALDRSDGLAVVLLYKTDLFERETAERWLRHFERLLEAAVTDPSRPVAQLPMLTDEELGQLVAQPRQHFPVTKCLHELFSEQAHRTPQATALSFAEEQLSYAELDHRSSLVASRLRRWGVGSEQLVALLCEPSLELVVGMLGILKAGGAYLPIDARHPAERVRTVLADSGARVLLTQAELAERLLEYPEQVLCLDTEWAELEREEAVAFEVGVSPSHLAYVIYTSGSTGKPKGVMVTHANVARLLAATQDDYEFDSRDTWTLFHSPAFDFSVWEVWGALLTGGRLLVVPHLVSRSPEVFYRLLVQEKVTVLNQTPSAFRVLSQVEETSGETSEQLEPNLEPLSLRLVIFGGEALELESLRGWFERHGAEQPRLVNMYGITETTVHVTYRPLSLADLGQASVIGEAIEDLQVYLLDGHGQPVPLGVPGELFVGGAGVARGYLGRPELTAERFVPDPFTGEPGARLYRSGDVGRRLRNGELEYLGRADRQVKIRGFRMELGEIEAALLAQAEVREAVVLMHEETPDDKKLVAYVVAQEAHARTSIGLRKELRERLPEYMVPSTFVFLDHLPLTPNGKVDQRALTEQNLAEEQEGEWVGPRTPIEEVVAGVWAEVLGVERVGVRDNFFELGGHSLLATQVVSRLRKALGVEVSLRALFEAPTVEGVSREIARVMAEGREPAPGIIPVTREGELPLSFAQQRLWFLQQLEPDSYLYNVPVSLYLTGELDVEALGQSINEVIRRHEVLRTSFPSESGQPRQLISPAEQWGLEVRDLRALPEAEREAEVKRVLEEDGRRPFDLGQGPVLRVQLLRVGEAEHVLQLTMHHIVSDGWSMGLLLKETATLYWAYSQGEKSPLAELPVQYADYAVWQREWLQGEVLDEQLNYWRKQLTGAPPALELPADRPRPPIQSPHGASLSLNLSAALSERVHELSRSHGATLYMTLLATFKLLLSRYAAQEDIVVGTPIAGRGHAELESLIGFFVNTLVLRTDVSGNPSFSELLGRVRRTCLEAYMHQDVPFERLVEELQPIRDLSRSPIFQVMFALQNAPAEGAAELPGLQLRPVESHERTSIFDLTFTAVNHGSHLAVAVQYNTDLFERETAEGWLRHFERLLEAVVSDSSMPVTQLPLLTDLERDRQLFEWNQTVTEYTDAPACLHELFEAQVVRTPGRVALVFENEELTYSELDQRAEALARYLRGRGVGPEAVVALMAERSIELVVGLLGVLKAGGAYLPVDPEYPRERTAFMLSNSRVSVLLTQRKFAERVPEEIRHVLMLDDKSWEAGTAVPENIAAAPGPLNVAYVIYTSGSTGVPKGAMNTHGAIVNRLLWMQDAYCLTPEDAVLQKTPFTFDVSVWEFFWPLLAGAQLVLARPGGHRESEYLADLIDHRHVTVLHFVPSMLQVFLQEPRLERCRSLKRVICSGEALPYDLQERFFERLPSVELHNLYGPTEAAVDVSYWRCERGSPRASVPIGRPIANVQLYVLDKRLEPAPVGVAGEIYIGGAGLARGYLDMPGLTAEKFVPSPFGPGVGARLYRTGDIGRYLTNASIEFLGRLDDQVKVRGFRVEPGEIEALLRSHTSVGDCVVVARRRGPADDRLVAYVVAKEGESAPSAAELRRHLQGHLPEYMVPSVFTTIERLPLTSSGKVDRRSLPEPEPGQLELAENYLASRTPVEEVVADVWAQVLGVERVGVRDNFFDLGGHSLLATQVMSRLRQALGVEVAVRALFETPTVTGVSRAVERELAAGREAAPPLKRVERVGELPLSFAQQRLWFLQQLEPNSSAYNIPVALRLKGRLNVDALRESFNEIVRRHEVLRTVFRKIDGEPMQVIEAAAAVSLPVTNLQDLLESEREKEIESAVRAEVDQVFDLAHGPLYRVRLLRTLEDEHVLLYTMHHIISDGWSMGNLLREMATLYQSFSHSQPSPLAELPVQYADYAVWQREWLQGEVLDQQLSYWREQLAGAPSALDLPADRPRPPVQSFRGANIGLTLDGDLTAQLKELSRRENATLYMTLLAAFKLLLARVAAQECVVVGTPIAGRRQTEVEGLIGFFVNTLVLRTDVSGELTFRELLARVRQVTVEAYSNQDVPFEKLVDELQPDRDLSRTPLFQVMFSFGTVEHEHESEGFDQLAVTSLKSENQTAKFDLTLALTDAGDRLSGSIEYSVDLFDEATIARLARHYVSLLEGIVANPDRAVSSLSLLTNEERKTLLEEWNDTAVDYPLSESVPKMFEQQVASTPDATAVVCGDVSLTYAELNRRANQLGHELRVLGVGVESRVGIMVQRSIDMVVGLLAILKTGGAYVPLDANYPRERLNFMARDSELQVVLTQSQLSTQLPDGVPSVILDTDRTKIDRTIDESDAENLDQPITADNLAYVLYTSGSTGQPKGVMVTHGGLSNYLNWCAATYNVTGGGGAPVHSPLGFDLTVTSILSPLVSGQTVTLLKEGIEELRETIREQRDFSLLKITPAHLEMLNQLLKGNEIAGTARCLIIGGDALFGESLAFWQENAPNTRLINEYGPTETVVGCCVYEVDAGLKLTGAVPIGRPIANTQLYVLDSTQQPVPVGVPGELYIGGAGLARGYLNQPELTAETFIPDPFSGTPGQRLYKTGDLARYLTDSNLVYLGRADRQLKIRGFRVEPGEVEAVLRQHEGVRDAAVAASGSDLSERQLVAYVVAHEDKSAVAAVELREFFKELVPEYMVPDTFVTIDEIPLTANGKVDYRRLASIDGATAGPRVDFVAPRNTVELELVHIWENTLNLARVGVTDKFFEIGGNSLLAVRLMSRIEKQFGKELPLATLFQAPTVEQLASVVRRHVGPEAWRPLVAIQPQGSRPPFFCIHPIGGTVLCYYDLARHLGEDQPFYALQAPGLLAEEDCQTSIEDMAKLYNRELREVQPSGPYRLGGWSFGGIVAFEMAQQLLRDGQSVALLALFDGAAPKYAGKVSDEVEDSIILAELLKERARSAGQELQIPHEEILGVVPEERLSYVLNIAKTAGVVPVEIELEWVSRFLRGFKLRAQAAGRYRPGIFPGQLTFFRSTDVDQDTIKAMARVGVDLNDLTRGWSELSAEPIEVITVPGYHETLMLEPHVQTLAERLRSCLNQPEPKKKGRSI